MTEEKGELPTVSNTGGKVRKDRELERPRDKGNHQQYTLLYKLTRIKQKQKRAKQRKWKVTNNSSDCTKRKSMILKWTEQRAEAEEQRKE